MLLEYLRQKKNLLLMSTLMLIICMHNLQNLAHVKKQLDHFKRADLCILDDDFGSVCNEEQER